VKKKAKKKEVSKKASTKKRKSVGKKITIKKESSIMAKAPTKRKRNRIAKAITKATSYGRRAKKHFGGTKHDIKTVAVSAGLGVMGAIIAAFVANKLPIKDKRIQAAVPLLAGIGATVSKLGTNKMLQPVLAGMIIGGGVSMVRQFVPGLATMAGEEDYSEYLPDNAYAGIEDFSGVAEITDRNISGVDDFGSDLENEFDSNIGDDENEMWATTQNI